MIEVMKERKMHAEIMTAITGLMFTIALIAFVDDTELFVTDEHDNPCNLIAKAEMALNIWRELLYVTGGIMRSSKCAWTLVTFTNAGKNGKIQGIDANPGDIWLPDEDAVVRKISRYDQHHPREYLGVMQTVTGSDEKQALSMENAVKDWNELIQLSKLPPAYNLQAMLTRIHKTLQYPLPTMTLSESRLQKISNALYWTSLPKCGIVRTFPIMMRHLPKRYQGLALPNLYVSQEISKTKEVLTNAYTDSILWEQMMVGLEFLQRQTGTLDIVLNCDYEIFGNLTEASWFKTLWKFMSNEKLTFKGWKGMIPLLRENDCGIMDLFSTMLIPKSEFETLNECRLYLQAWTIADITDGSGTRISSYAYEGKRDEDRKSTMQWPKRNRPHFHKWLIWQRWIGRAFCQQNRVLRVPLGKWNNDPRQEWKWYCNPDTQVLYKSLGNGNYKKFLLSRNRLLENTEGSRWYTFQAIERRIEPLPDIWQRATICKYSKGRKYVQSDGTSSVVITPMMNNANCETLFGILEQKGIPTWMRTYGNIENITTTDLNVLFSQPIRLVTDASCKDHKGAACIIIEPVDKSMQIIFTTNVPMNLNSTKAYNDSYRCEMMGIYAGLKVWKAIEQYTNQSTTLTISCDNDQALFLTSEYDYITSSQNHYDLARAVVAVRKQITSTLYYEEVMGHTEDKFLDRPYTRVELLNQSCDRIAKTAREQYTDIPLLHFEDEGISLWHQHTKIFTKVHQYIQDKHNDAMAKTYLCQKYSWTSRQFNEISWEALRKATDMMSTPTQIRMSKCVTGTLPTGKNMERRKEWHQAYCPRCRCPNETNLHIIQCPSAESQILARTLVMKLNEWLEKMNTPQDLRTQLIELISTYVSNTPISINRQYLTPITKQLELGWNHFMQGRIHISFQIYMDNHYARIDSKKSGMLWTTLLVHKLWTSIFTEQWNQRNEFVHAINRKIQTSREHENLNVTVRQIFSEEMHKPLLYRDRHLMEQPLSTIIRKPSAQKRAWIHMMQVATVERNDAHLRDTFRQSNAMHRFLRNRSNQTQPSNQIIVQTPEDLQTSPPPLPLPTPTPIKKRRVNTKPRRRILSAHDRWEMWKRRKMKGSIPRQREKVVQNPPSPFSQRYDENTVIKKRRVNTKPRRRILSAYERWEMRKKRRIKERISVSRETVVHNFPPPLSRENTQDTSAPSKLPQRWNRNGTKETMRRGSWRQP